MAGSYVKTPALMHVIQTTTLIKISTYTLTEQTLNYHQSVRQSLRHQLTATGVITACICARLTCCLSDMSARALADMRATLTDISAVESHRDAITSVHTSQAVRDLHNHVTCRTDGNRTSSVNYRPIAFLFAFSK